jgi:hypothetical protein
MFSRSEPGLPISATLHVTLLAATLLVFAKAPKFEEALETVPVEVVSSSQLNEISKGEKSAKAAPKPAQRTEKAEKVETRREPPQAEAKRDVPAPPPSFRRTAEPNANDAPKAEKEAPTPPRRVAAHETPAPPKPAPTPPAHAKATPEPEEQPDEAEVTRPKPPTKPKIEKVEKETPAPPEKPKEKPRLKVDEVAKLLQRQAPKEAGAGKPKSGDEAAPKSKFNANSIANLLSREAPQQRASSARERSQVASLGAPTGAAAHLSPSMEARIGQYIKDHYQPCWKSGLSLGGETYSPIVRFHLTRDGALEGAPRLMTSAGGAVEQARSQQAIQAVRRCSPMRIPPEFAPFYEEALHEVDIKFSDVD